MKLRHLATLVLALFVAGFLSTAEGAVIHSMGGQAQAGQDASFPCPDPGSQGDPCGPDCPCACCPGHRLAVAFPALGLPIVAPAEDKLDSFLPDDLHPQESDQRIFHPPRA